MSEPLGKIEKPAVEDFKIGRKLFFVPLVYPQKEEAYQKIFAKYWQQAADQIEQLESKLGEVSRIFHELVAVGGEEGANAIKEINESSYQITLKCLDKGAQLETIEEAEVLSELMDWSRCLAVGIASQKALSTIYTAYTEASQRRNEHTTLRISKTLKSNEIAILFMREGHQIQFPPDVQVFYVSPPALDEIKRWLRDFMAKQPAADATEQEPSAEATEEEPPPATPQ